MDTNYVSHYTKKLERGREISYGFHKNYGNFIRVIKRLEKPDSNGNTEIDLVNLNYQLHVMSDRMMAELMTAYDLPQCHIDQVLAGKVIS